jgi:hypothetical protein
MHTSLLGINGKSWRKRIEKKPWRKRNVINLCINYGQKNIRSLLLGREILLDNRVIVKITEWILESSGQLNNRLNLYYY